MRAQHHTIMNFGYMYAASIAGNFGYMYAASITHRVTVSMHGKQLLSDTDFSAIDHHTKITKRYFIV